MIEKIGGDCRTHQRSLRRVSGPSRRRPLRQEKGDWKLREIGERESTKHRAGPVGGATEGKRTEKGKKGGGKEVARLQGDGTEKSTPPSPPRRSPCMVVQGLTNARKGEEGPS